MVQEFSSPIGAALLGFGRQERCCGVDYFLACVDVLDIGADIQPFCYQIYLRVAWVFPIATSLPHRC